MKRSKSLIIAGVLILGTAAQAYTGQEAGQDFANGVKYLYNAWYSFWHWFWIFLEVNFKLTSILINN